MPQIEECFILIWPYIKLVNKQHAEYKIPHYYNKRHHVSFWPILQVGRDVQVNGKEKWKIHSWRSPVSCYNIKILHSQHSFRATEMDICTSGTCPRRTITRKWKSWECRCIIWLTDEVTRNHPQPTCSPSMTRLKTGVQIRPPAHYQEEWWQLGKESCGVTP